jgi:hypothetical protein
LWRSGALYLAGVAALLAFWIGPREAVLSELTVGPLVLVTELFSLLMPVALGRWLGARLDAPRAGQPGPLSRLMTTKAGWLLRLLRRAMRRRHRSCPMAARRCCCGDQAEALFGRCRETRLGSKEWWRRWPSASARSLHQRDSKLGAALVDVGSAGDARRDGVRRELEEEQRATRAALGEIVATLDALRLDLLRLRAGTLTAEG